MTRIVLGLFLDFLQCDYLGSLCRIWLQLNLLACLLSSLNLSQSLLRPVCFAFLWLLLRFLCIIISCVIQGKCTFQPFALVFRLGILRSTNEVRLFLKKFQFSLMSFEFGFMWKYVVVS